MGIYRDYRGLGVEDFWGGFQQLGVLYLGA